MYASLGEGMDQFDEEQEGEDIFGPPETKKATRKWKIVVPRAPSFGP